MEELESYCLVCNTAIQLPSSPILNNDAHDEDAASKREVQPERRVKSSGAVKSAAPAAAVHGRRTSTDAATNVHRRPHAVHTAHAHGLGPASKVRRNHSSGKLAALTAAATGITTARPSHTKGKSSDPTLSSSSTTSHNPDHVEATPDVPAWMAIYCSEQCKEADENRSKATLATLTEERNRILSASKAYSVSPNRLLTRLSPTSSNHNQLPRQSSHTSLPRRGSFSNNGYPSSPLANDSDGSEYDWSSGVSAPRIRGNRSTSRLSDIGNRRDSSDSGHYHASGMESTSRRYPHAGEMSHSSSGRRSSSRPRGSTDSLASLYEHPAEEEQAACSEGDYFHNHHHHLPNDLVRPPPRTTSALGNGLRAMTPIHGSSPKLGSPRLTSRASLTPSLGPSNALRNEGESSPMTRSSSESVAATGTSATIRSPLLGTVKPLRPRSLGRAGLHMSKSSASLAVNTDAIATGTISSADQLQYRSGSGRAHASTASIPYLSCSPSSPGSGSIHSARSTASTAPSSSSARGEHDDDYHHHRIHRKAPQVDEEHRAVSLASYGLFLPRTPSTPSLTGLDSSSGLIPARSSSISRASRLSASFDTMASCATVTKSRQPQAPYPSSFDPQRRVSEQADSSPRRLHLDLPDTSPRKYNAAAADITPTASTAVTRSPSLVPVRGPSSYNDRQQYRSSAVAYRTRAPSITRTDLTRNASTVSVDSLLSDHLSQRYSPLVDAKSGQTTGTSSSSNAHLFKDSQVMVRQISQPDDFAHHGEDEDARPTLPPARSKSRTSFTWDHLPAYIPRYEAMDVDKIRRNMSLANLSTASIVADDGNVDEKPDKPVHRKRLFYFSDDFW
ncbi:hypothetical protein EMMF5_004185 [Cystobasidiomycetes sp. EMM_F5]